VPISIILLAFLAIDDAGRIIQYLPVSTRSVAIPVAIFCD
jgi:hypothetical protein